MTSSLRRIGQSVPWRNFIGGEWVESSSTLDVENPASGEVIGRIACADAASVDQAVQAAGACVQSGALTGPRPAERTALLLRIAAEVRAMGEEGGHIGCLENGKGLADAIGEFDEAARYFEYYAGMADKIEGASIPLGAEYVDYTIHEPHGVSAQIIPWNFPVSLCARSLAPALAAGNAVVVKSPELSPLAVTWLVQACERAGMPEGAVNLVCGYGRVAGAALVAHPGVNQIVFTGSVPTGKAIMHAAAERAVPCVMELGGKSAAIVYPDADLDNLLDSVKAGAFFNAGQVCSAMARLLVHESVYDEVLMRVTNLVEGLSMGPGHDNPDITPLISSQQLERVETMCRRAVEEGACLVTGGSRSERLGNFMQPTVFADVTADMTIAREEVFGPVLAVMKFANEDEAFAVANGTDYGLVAGVFTENLNTAVDAPRRLFAGQVFVNEWFAGGIETPFGGTRLSGYGREKGQEALYSYVRTKNVAIRVRR